MRWEHFAHDADVGVRGFGASPRRSVRATRRSRWRRWSSTRRVVEREVVEIACEGADDEMLLVDFLNAIVFEMATRRLLFARFEVSSDGPRLRARARGARR